MQAVAQPPPFPDFIRPWPLAAVATMAVNDHWLKPRFHNFWTGKLSDLAICFFLPLFLAALLELSTPLGRRARLFAGVATTVVLFFLLKTSAPFARAFCLALSPVAGPLGFEHLSATVDPTDLWALPMSLIALWYVRPPRPPRPGEAA